MVLTLPYVHAGNLKISKWMAVSESTVRVRDKQKGQARMTFVLMEWDI
jgi:hypothetical protein